MPMHQQDTYFLKEIHNQIQLLTNQHIKPQIILAGNFN